MTKGERQELEALWHERISDLRSSGMTIVAWAEANHVSPYRVYYWLRKFRQAQEEPAPSRPRFVAVTVAEPNDKSSPPMSSPPITVRVGSYSLEVHAGCDMELLSRVVRTLTTV